MADTKNIAKDKKTDWFFQLLVFILSLAALGGVAYIYYQGNLMLGEVKRSVAYLQTRVNSNEELVSRLSGQLQVRLDAVESKLNAINNRNYDFTLLHLNELISMANQLLVVYSDVRGALRLLNYANDLLKSNSSSQYVEIKNAINNDLNKLGQLQYADTVFLASKLNSLSEQVGMLSLVDEKKLKVEEGHLGESGADNKLLWVRIWNNIKNDFKSLVVVTKMDQNNAIGLLPEKEVIIRQNAKLYLLNARIALLQHDEELWRMNLISLRDDINNYFAKTTLSELLVDNIKNLLSIDIMIRDLNMNDTLKAMINLNKLQK